MSTSKFTSGPWKLENDGSLVMGGQVIANPDQLKPDGATRDEGKANARLMSAAPEMLTALKQIMAHYKFIEGGLDFSDAWKAISKAESHDE